MQFDDMFNQYMLGATVSEHQARFIWNQAIEHFSKKLVNELHPNLEQDILEISESELIPIKVPNYFS